MEVSKKFAKPQIYAKPAVRKPGPDYSLHSRELIISIMSFFTYSMAGRRESFWTLTLKYRAALKKFLEESVMVN